MPPSLVDVLISAYYASSIPHSPQPMTSSPPTMTHSNQRPHNRVTVIVALVVFASGRCGIAAEPLRVKAMTFNIRCDVEKDGQNRWAPRREWVPDLIRRADCDFVGIQEALPHQRGDLDRMLQQPSYRQNARADLAAGYVSRSASRTGERSRGNLSRLLRRPDQRTQNRLHFRESVGQGAIVADSPRALSELR